MDSSATHDLSRVRARLGDWRDRLVDLSRRNPLIHFSGSAATTIWLTAPSLAELTVEDAPPRTFYIPPPDEEREKRSRGDAAIPWGPPQPPTGHLVTTRPDGRALHRAVERLARRGRSDFEDKAIRTLHLVAGFLEWHDAAGESLLSPVLLVPVTIDRESPRHPYHLAVVDDEEPLINPALSLKLERELGIDLPSDWAWEGKPVNRELDEVEEALRGRGVTMRREAAIGRLNFQKLVMYRDLLEHEERIVRHPLVRTFALGERTQSMRERAEAVPSLETLDDVETVDRTRSILDADSSQRRAILAARNGASFVVQGPPGTGKSQTIANVIAETIADGRTVLFVSEKLAALDVVFNRLKEVGLDQYCLRLHGENAARKEVVEALSVALRTRLRPPADMSQRELGRLAELRGRLNEAVRELHDPRPELLGRTLFEVHGDLARLGGGDAVALAPGVTGEEDGIEPGWAELSELRDIAVALTPLWSLRANADNPWRGLHVSQRWTAGARQELEAQLRTARDACEAARHGIRALESALGLDPTDGLAAARRLVARMVSLREAPAVPLAWHAPAAAQRAAESLTEAREVLARLTTLELHAERFGVRDPAEFPPAAEERLDEALNALRLALDVGPSADDALLRDREALRALSTTGATALARMAHAARELAHRLGQPAEGLGMEDVHRCVSLARLLVERPATPDGRWLTRLGLEQARDGLAVLEPLIYRWRGCRERAEGVWREEAFELDAEAFRARFGGQHTSALRSLRKQYRQDRQALTALTHEGQMPEDPVAALTLLIDERTAARTCRELPSAERLGPHFAGERTDIERVRATLDLTGQALDLSSPWADHERFETAATSLALDDVGRLLDVLEGGHSEFRGLADACARSVGPSLDPQTVALEALEQRLAQVSTALGPWETVVCQGDRVMGSTPTKAAQLREPLRLADELRAQRVRVAAGEPGWRDALAGRFEGVDTDWLACERTLEWLARQDEDLETQSPEVRRLVAGEGDWPELDLLPATLEKADETLLGLLERFADDSPTSSALDGAGFEQVTGLVTLLLDRLDDIQQWAESEELLRRAEAIGWRELFTHLAREEHIEGDLAEVAERSFWLGRVEAALERLPVNRDFSVAAHNAQLDEFRELDGRLVTTGAGRVVKALNERRPARVSLEGSETYVIEREARKQRRFKPVRRLLAEIPKVLPLLKPCLMMSPLTVSHFLDAEHEFDVVVFDEASQVPPEDAVNALYRGRQVIVAGDSRQLPPTRFFDVGDRLADEWEEEGDDDEEVMESLLESAEVVLPRPEPDLSLSWHYRSRHHDLIAFSNHHFYEDGLQVFPGTGRQRPVSFRLVEGGLYDRGGTKRNEVEAVAVAERVVEHLRAGQHSVGVIALNHSQADAIEDHLVRLRLEHPELEEHFSDDRLGGVFVKNLESVQGDEREVILFSVGYGYDTDGRFPMTFGPLNGRAGPRRLNVAVTRARQAVEVFASVRPDDFRVTDTSSRGLRLLRDYLAYAEHGAGLLPSAGPAANGHDGGGFEAEVARTVQALGFEVVPRVGVAGYRLDLGVVDPRDPERFVLGIECDGVSYSEAATARDRERLRSQVLRGLGWRLHRVWSAGWTRRHDEEVERLRSALEAARDGGEAIESLPTVDLPAAETDDEPDIAGADGFAEADWVEDYRVVHLGAGHATPAGIREMLIKVVDTEGPVARELAFRRIAEACGTRLGGRFEAEADDQLRALVRSRQVRRNHEFLSSPSRTLRSPRRPSGADPHTQRPIEHIPPQEIDLALSQLATRAGLTGDALVTATARLFGFRRTGATIAAAIEPRAARMKRDAPPEDSAIQRSEREAELHGALARAIAEGGPCFASVWDQIVLQASATAGALELYIARPSGLPFLEQSGEQALSTLGFQRSGSAFVRRVPAAPDTAVVAARLFERALVEAFSVPASQRVVFD
jgi:hypothetical protein